MPFDVKDVGFLAPDFVEFIVVFITMGIAFLVMVGLGKWWER